MPIIHPPPYNQESELERKLRQQDRQPKELAEVDGKRRRAVVASVIVVIVLSLVLGGLLYGLFVGF